MGGGRCGSVRVRVRGRRPATRRRRQRAGYCQSGDSGGRILPSRSMSICAGRYALALVLVSGYLVGLLRRSLVASDWEGGELSCQLGIAGSFMELADM